MASNEEGCVVQEPASTVRLDIQLLQKVAKEINENKKKFDELSEKLKSIETLLQKSKDVSEKDPIAESTIPYNNTTNMPSKTVKRFQLKHVFKDVVNFKHYKYNYSKFEDHYNVKWRMMVIRRYRHLGFFICCSPIAPSDQWSIRTKLEYKVVGRVQNDIIRTFDYCYEADDGWGFCDFLEWKEMEQRYLVDGNLTVEAKVTIIETTGLEKPKIRKFDESQKDISDVILVVSDTKFYVSKTYLASQSDVFKALLFGNFKESKKSEVTLNGIDPNDFHYFLEVLYGEFVIDESNVEDIALLADMYDAPTAIRRCERFLLETSKKALEKKLEIATRYNLENLKEKCLSEMRKIASKNSKVSKRNPVRKFLCF